MRKNNKRALIVSMLSLLLCVSMLVGSTMAWFTDTASVSGNKLEAGTLDIELYRGIYSMNNYMDNPDSYEALSEDPLVPEDILWEPGYLWYDNLIIRNAGSLAAKFKATLVPEGEVGELAKVIDVYVSDIRAFVDYYGDETKNVRDYIAGKYAPTLTGNPMQDAFAQAYGLPAPKKIGTLEQVINGQVSLAVESWLPGVAEGEESSEHMLCIALKMQETAGNEYQGKSAGSFDIRVVATQMTHEEDSYDDQYDKNAAYPVSSAIELNAALKDTNVTDVSVVGGNYNETVKIPAGKNLVSDNGTFKPDVKWDAAMNVEAGASVTLNGGTYMSSGQQILNVQTNDATVIINDGTYNGSALAWNCGNNGIEINGGEFNVWTISVTDSGTDGVITINGGNFTMTAADGFNAGTSVPMVINGGTFNQNPSEFVNADTHKVVENADGTFTVTAK